MKTVQMTLDEDLVKAVDKIVKKIHTSRSAFTRKALREAIQRFNVSRLESQHRRGYEISPVTSSEFSIWANEQEWGDG